LDFKFEKNSNFILGKKEKKKKEEKNVENKEDMNQSYY
jgi:hypothetical protein